MPYGGSWYIPDWVTPGAAPMPVQRPSGLLPTASDIAAARQMVRQRQQGLLATQPAPTAQALATQPRPIAQAALPAPAAPQAPVASLVQPTLQIGKNPLDVRFAPPPVRPQPPGTLPSEPYWSASDASMGQPKPQTAPTLVSDKADMGGAQPQPMAPQSTPFYQNGNFWQALSAGLGNTAMALERGSGIGGALGAFGVGLQNATMQQRQMAMEDAKLQAQLKGKTGESSEFERLLGALTPEEQAKAIRGRVDSLSTENRPATWEPVVGEEAKRLGVPDGVYQKSNFNEVKLISPETYISPVETMRLQLQADANAASAANAEATRGLAGAQFAALERERIAQQARFEQERADRLSRTDTVTLPDGSLAERNPNTGDVKVIAPASDKTARPLVEAANTLQAYGDLIRQYGKTGGLTGEGKSRIGTQYELSIAALGQLRDAGVIQPSEYETLQRALTNVSDWTQVAKMYAMGIDPLAQIDQLTSEINRKITARGGKPVEAPAAAAPAQTAPAAPAAPAAGPAPSPSLNDDPAYQRWLNGTQAN